MIHVEHLVKTFGDVQAVRDISFDVAKGEVFAFLGPNGAGKTTTIKMLTTLLRPTSGTLLLNGFDPTKQPLEARRSFGIVFQDQSLDDELTAEENMELHAILYRIPRQEQATTIEKLLRFVELWDRRKSYVKTFSGGMKRRLEIARGLLHKPAILFLDEPTLGLDPQTRNHMWEYVHSLSKSEGVTIFFTTHYMEEAERVADRVAIIDHGTIITIGTPAELKAQTKTPSLEDAFLALTGQQLRTEDADDLDHMRLRRSMNRR